jgi:hypothetical protein
MARELFVDKRFTEETLERIAQANGIIAEYARQGYSLTLRQLYYQFVARGLLKNEQREYKRLGETVNAGRLAGLIDWNAIEDRTRNLSRPSAWDSPAKIIEAAAHSYAIDMWKEQDWYVEVWVEKEALMGVIERACQRYRVPFFACRGYTSQSEQYAAGKRFANKLAMGKRVRVIHLGDHDPSGLDMTRDNDTRLEMFTRGEPGLEIRRVALNMDQVEKYDPPPNPAKMTDSRAEDYVLMHGESSWELDALDPSVIADLINDSVEELLDMDQWRKDQKTQERGRTLLTKIAARWEDVKAMLEDKI